MAYFSAVYVLDRRRDRLDAQEPRKRMGLREQKNVLRQYNRECRNESAPNTPHKHRAHVFVASYKKDRPTVPLRRSLSTSPSARQVVVNRFLWQKHSAAIELSILGDVRSSEVLEHLLLYTM